MHVTLTLTESMPQMDVHPLCKDIKGNATRMSNTVQLRFTIVGSLLKYLSLAASTGGGEKC